MWRDGAFEMVASPLLMAELRRVLAYPKIRSRVRETEAEAFLTLLRQGATIVEAPVQPPALRTPDPHDDYLVVLAEGARAVIVSGDKHLLGMSDRLPVYSPVGFRRFMSTREDD